LTSIAVPDGVTSIRSNTFAGCTALTSVTLPPSLTAIGPNAFEQCGALAAIAIPPTVAQIGEDAFNACACLTQLTFGENATASIAISDSAFLGCPVLVTADFGIRVGEDATVGSTRSLAPRDTVARRAAPAVVCVDVRNAAATARVPVGAVVLAINGVPIKTVGEAKRRLKLLAVLTTPAGGVATVVPPAGILTHNVRVVGGGTDEPRRDATGGVTLEMLRSPACETSTMVTVRPVWHRPTMSR
jgi:hypothetical protein